MSMIFNEGLTTEQLEALFESDENCLEFLANLKWDKGFVCRKCGNTNYVPEKAPHSAPLYQMQIRRIGYYRNHLPQLQIPD